MHAAHGHRTVQEPHAPRAVDHDPTRHEAHDIQTGIQSADASTDDGTRAVGEIAFEFSSRREIVFQFRRRSAAFVEGAVARA